MSWLAPDHGLCRNFTELASTSIFIVYLPPSGVHVSYQSLQYANTLLLMLPDQHDVTNVMNQYDVLQCVQMVQMSSG